MKIYTLRALKISNVGISSCESSQVVQVFHAEIS